MIANNLGLVCPFLVIEFKGDSAAQAYGRRLTNASDGRQPAPMLPNPSVAD